MTPLVAKMEREFPELLSEARAAHAIGHRRPVDPSGLWLVAEDCFVKALGPDPDVVLAKMREPMRDFMLLQAMAKARRLVSFDCTCESDPLGRCTLHGETTGNI